MYVYACICRHGPGEAVTASVNSVTSLYDANVI